MGKNKVKFGLSNVHYAVKKVATDGTISYEKPVKIPGAVNLTLNAEGSQDDFYADDMAYYTSTKNNGYSGNLEIADIPESFKTDVLGEELDDNGALIENSRALIKDIALMFEVKGDQKNRRVVYYNVKVARPSTTAETETDSSTPQTDTLDFKASPREDTEDTRATLELNDTNESIYNSFYQTVYEKNAA